jgi:hypothetical protein
MLVTCRHKVSPERGFPCIIYYYVRPLSLERPIDFWIITLVYVPCFLDKDVLLNTYVHHVTLALGLLCGKRGA